MKIVHEVAVHLSNQISANLTLQNHLPKEIIIASYIYSVAEYKKNPIWITQ